MSNAINYLAQLNTNEIRDCLEQGGHTGLDQLDPDQLYSLALEVVEDGLADD